MKNSLMPSHPHGQKLCKLFPYRWRWIEAPLDDHSLTPPWSTNTKFPLKDRLLWSRHQDAGTLVGVRFGRSTEYAMIDVDKNSPYLEQIDSIKLALETIGIVRTVVIRSSWSGGVHIYAPLPQAFPTFSVACALEQALKAQGFHIAGGELECFPNVKSYSKFWLGEFSEYTGHRLPLQPGSGSCLIDEDGNPLARGHDLALFFAQWENAAQLNDVEAIAQALCIARANHSRRRRRRATGPVEQWKEDLEQIIQQGWTGPGQTNHLLKEIATYSRVFKGLSDKELLFDVFHTATECPGYEEHCSHRYELHRRCDAWARAVEKYYWPIGEEPLRERRPLQSINQERADDARSRIAQAKAFITEQLGIKELAKRLCEWAHCSLQTLYKHQDLWHPHPKRVTDRTASDTAEAERIRRVIIESLESTDIASVTPQGGENEACNLKSPPLKNSPPEGKKRGCGGEEGFSTGWLPKLDWIEGAVGDL